MVFTRGRAFPCHRIHATYSGTGHGRFFILNIPSVAVRCICIAIRRLIAAGSVVRVAYPARCGAIGIHRAGTVIPAQPVKLAIGRLHIGKHIQTLLMAYAPSKIKAGSRRLQTMPVHHTNISTIGVTAAWNAISLGIAAAVATPGKPGNAQGTQERTKIPPP